MGLPDFNAEGLLPAFVGAPTGTDRSPYKCGWDEFAEAFGGSPGRTDLLRRALRPTGLPPRQESNMMRAMISYRPGRMGSKPHHAPGFAAMEPGPRYCIGPI